MFDFTNFDPYSMDFIRKFQRNDLLEPLCEIGNIELQKKIEENFANQKVAERFHKFSFFIISEKITKSIDWR